MHGVEKNNGYKRLQIALKITVRKQNNFIRRKKFKAQRTTKKKKKKNRQDKADDCSFPHRWVLQLPLKH